MLQTRLAITALAAAGAVLVGAQNETPNNSTMPTSIFHTRPLSQAPVLNVSISGDFSQGYVFIAPYQAVHSGPYIYDKFGNLVFDGYGLIGSANAHDFRPCEYQGAAHLCFSQMNQQLGYGIGQGMIVDTNYRVVATVNLGGNAPPADMHEFQLANGGETAIMSAYQAIPYDLSAYGITSGMGWLLQGVFQEVNVTTGDVLFEWFSSNHVDPSDTDIKPNTTDVSGDGKKPGSAFDYFHINSIDKSSQSLDYLVSARHTSSVYLINSTDRSILWTLSCTGRSDIKCNDFNFTFQHDARFISENDTTTVISLFDNASNGYAKSNTQSSGMIIAIDLASKTATLLSQTFFPRDGGILSASQGNTQVLSNGNVFHGWGNWAYVSEHDPSGNPLFFAQFASDKTMNYRAFSADWQSTPCCTVPEVYAYAQNTTAPNRVYVSWNGATTVAKWNFYGSDNMGDEFPLIGTVEHAGFETMFEAPEFHMWWWVEAVGPDGTSLRYSHFQPTFVPGADLEAACGIDGCAMAS